MSSWLIVSKSNLVLYPKIAVNFVANHHPLEPIGVGKQVNNSAYGKQKLDTPCG